MAFSTFNSIQSFMVFINNAVSSGLSYVFNYPSLDPSMVLYYPLDISATIGTSNGTPNYGSRVNGVATYDASFVGTGALINTTANTFITGLGDLSLNNTMGSTATNYVVANNSFNLNPSGGLTISLWFTTTGVATKTGTLVSLPRVSGANGIEIDISGTNMIYSGYYIPGIADSTATVRSILNLYTTAWLDANVVVPQPTGATATLTSWPNQASSGATYNATPVGTITINNSPRYILVTANTPYFNNALNIGVQRLTAFFVFSVNSNITTVITFAANGGSITGSPYGNGSNSILLIGPQSGPPANYSYSIQLYKDNIVIPSIGSPWSNCIYTTLPSSIVTGTKYLISISFNSSTSYATAATNTIIRFNGSNRTVLVSPNTPQNGYILQSSGCQLGNIISGFPNAFSTNMFETILISGTSLPITDIKTIETYLNTKWSLGYTIT